MILAPPITSRTNAKVKALRAAFSGKASEPGEMLGLEGETLLTEALRSGIQAEAVFVRQGDEKVLSDAALRGVAGSSISVLSRDVFASAVDTNSPQGIAALIAIPPPPQIEKLTGTVLLVEAMQDPGNLGTLLRTAEAFGATQVFLTPESVNQWSPKTVRASAGSVFRILVRRMALDDIGRTLRRDGVRILAAVAQSQDAISCVDADLTGDCALMIGNEGAGLSAAALSFAEVRIHVPCATESLNAAAAGSVLMYEAMRQRIKAGSTR